MRQEAINWLKQSESDLKNAEFLLYQSAEKCLNNAKEVLKWAKTRLK